MQYIEKNGNRLIVKKSYENSNDGSYWIIVSFSSKATKDVPSNNMSMQLFVKGGEVVNRTITINETPYTLSVSSHKYIGDVYEDASRISFDYKNENAIGLGQRSKHDEIELDNFIVNEKGENVRNIFTKEKEKEAIKSLFDINGIFIDQDTFVELFQVDLDFIKDLTKDDKGQESQSLTFKYVDESVNKIFASKRTLSNINYVQKQK